MLGLGLRFVGTRARSLLLASALIGLSGPAPAHAQTNPRSLDLQLFLPPAAGGATFTVDRTTVPRHLNAVFGIAGNYALEPFTRSETVVDGTVVFPAQPVVRHMVQLEAMAALGLFEFVELGVVLPVGIVDYARNDNLLDPTYVYSTEVGLADLRLSAKVPIIRGDFSLSGRFVAQLPTGDHDRFLGTEYWIATPSILLGGDLGVLRIVGDVGYRFRQRRTLPGFELDDEIHLAAGLVVPVVEELEVIADTQLRIGVGGRTVRENEIPWEVDAGVRIWPVSGLSVEVGAGTGILAGYGVPAVRAFAAVRFATEQDQGCAAGPEDFDGFQDGDFCADTDNDEDGLDDSSDECPNDAEDIDEFRDEDGCPDTDNDADGVVDDDDSCPTQSEDRDGYQDDDGCPEPDNDDDGIPDGMDDCPMEPEDRDRYQDEDGCPEPGPEEASVTVTDTRILISERIYFDFDRDTIRGVSTPLLDQVAGVIRELSSDLRIRVDGYSDDEGVRAYNVDLSYRRARAVVEYLVGRNVPLSRLEYRGYGPDNPVAPNDSPEGRALNRRVEFTILQSGESAGNQGRRRR